MPGKKPKGDIMTQTEMIEAGKTKRTTSRLYKAESMQITDEAISQTVAKGLAQMIEADSRPKINLSDIQMVKDVSIQYMKACADTSTFPTMSGLALAMGCDRSTLYRWMMHKQDTETSQWLKVCHNLYSEILAEASLRNNCNPIVSIFLQKAMYGLRDNVTIDINQTQDEEFNDDLAGDYKKKYRNLIGG